MSPRIIPCFIISCAIASFFLCMQSEVLFENVSVRAGLTALKRSLGSSDSALDVLITCTVCIEQIICIMHTVYICLLDEL